jgi:hypothetical protein
VHELLARDRGVVEPGAVGAALELGEVDVAEATVGGGVI